MSDTYTRFDRATANHTAYALIRDGKPVGRIVLKHTDAACTAFVQVWGAEMTTGRAGGGGYDRATAAVEAAVRRLDMRDSVTIAPNTRDTMRAVCEAFVSARDGTRYTDTLERAGFILALVIG